MTDRRYQVAFIGCGGRAREHAPAFVADSRCRVSALVDLNAEAAENLKRDFSFDADVYTDYRKMLEEQKPDIAVITLWTPLHLPVFRDCVEAGVRAVLSEKPMAPTWGDSLEMASIAERTGCQLTFCHQRRFASGNRQVREWIRQEVFGDILRMDLYSWPNLLDCGTHTIDQALSFLSEAEAEWVLGAVDASDPLEWFNVKAETMAFGTIALRSGVRATLSVGVPGADMGAGVRLFGTKGFIEVGWDGEIGKYVLYDEPARKLEVPEPKPGEQMVGVVRNAVDCLVTGEEPELSYKKALRATEIIFAFYESVRQRGRISLPLYDLYGVTDNPFVSMLESGELGRRQSNAE
ncbi:Gfo/Idh/MocA family oxidoreductase (plasmid) [Paenibacillus rhizovicinus]|uniref:Gfo/Idh/MocA family oxidoreductase n=1 Tax=Paenibacillus rhizovicinus TaxID=2704463 RepID=A0A6C0PAP4_9BACL|nr:Gfo/Idh/MocA family oxidoreductase [Paenibacillus rhizovicinus]QHW35506.1 Gfo/Idh/MocA family oxidoreductase [Paenibacillus rhizovicinus]